MDANQLSSSTTVADEIDAGVIDGISKLIPVSLLRKLNSKQITGIGKMKVVLRVQNNRSPVPIAIVPPSPNKNLKQTDSSSGSTTTGTTIGQFFNIDKKKKQITLFDPNQSLVNNGGNGSNGSNGNDHQLRKLPVAPKMFLFDAVFTSEDSQKDVCSAALNDVIHAVIEGNDGCLFCLGQADIGKSFTMFGHSKPNCYGDYGAIFFTIIWLFRCVSERQAKTGTRFTIRVSAIEISGPANTIKDLLVDCLNGNNDSVTFQKNHSQFQNVNELDVPDVERAIFYLNAALKKRTADTKKSHFLFSIHVDQSTVNGIKIAAVRSRLHLLDIGSCLSLAGLGNILLAIFNGQKHLPNRDHRLTNILKECLGSLMCQVSIIVHVSSRADSFNDTLTTLQLASRIYRIRRRRFKFLTSNWSNFDDQSRLAMLSNSEPDPSSSDFSADTVIYLGPSMDDATDNEHPPLPSALPSQPTIKSPVPYLPSPQKLSAKSSLKSPMKKPTEKSFGEEKWIDGPKISKQKLANAQKLLKVKRNETWIDGPQSPKKSAGGSYGFMDGHKKTMIKQWIEAQTKLAMAERVYGLEMGGGGGGGGVDDDDDEVAIPPALPLITPLSCTNSREASIEDLMLKEKRWEQLRKQEQCVSSSTMESTVAVQDRSVQVSEQDIDYQKYLGENPLPESDQDSYENFHDLSEEDLTIVSTFTDSLSILNDFERIFVNGQCDSIDRRTQQFLKKNQTNLPQPPVTITTSAFGAIDDIESLDRYRSKHNKSSLKHDQIPVLSPEHGSLYSEPGYYTANYPLSDDFHIKTPTFLIGNFAKIEPIKVENGTGVATAAMAANEFRETKASTIRNDSSTKHSPATVSRRAESGYHSSSVVPEDMDEDLDEKMLKQTSVVIRGNGRPECVRYRRKKSSLSLCSWFLRPFTSKYIDGGQPDETNL